MADITVNCPVDPVGHYFEGVEMKLPGGIPIPGTNFAIQKVALYGPNLQPILYGLVHGDDDLGGGIKLQGRAVVTAPAASTNNKRIDVWVDQFGRVVTRLCDQFGNPLISGPNALTDTFANPTTGSIGSHLMGWVPGNVAWERVQSVSGALKVLLASGSLVIGKVGIDQTTPGTTDSVSVATAQGAGATIGATGDASVAAGAVGSLSAKLRRLTEDLAALMASASVLDDWDESDRAKVNPIVGVAGVQGNTGVVTTSTQRVTLATDVKLPAGDNIIGSIAGGGIFQAAQSVPIGSTSASGAVVGAVTNNRLMGYSFQENGSPSGVARFVLHNHATSASAPILYASLGPGESLRDWFGPAGKVASAGVYLEMISGTVVGQLDMKQVA